MEKGKMWPLEAWCGAGWKKKNHKFLQIRKTCVQMEMVLDPWTLTGDLANNLREAPSIALGGGGPSEAREAETPSAPSITEIPRLTPGQWEPQRPCLQQRTAAQLPCSPQGPRPLGQGLSKVSLPPHAQAP